MNTLMRYGPASWQAVPQSSAPSAADEETPVGKDVSQETREEPQIDPPGPHAVVQEEIVRPVPHDDSSSSRASIWREYRSK